jgi:hypothetical protein
MDAMQELKSYIYAGCSSRWPELAHTSMSYRQRHYLQKILIKHKRLTDGPMPPDLRFHFNAFIHEVENTEWDDASLLDVCAVCTQLHFHVSNTLYGMYV